MALNALNSSYAQNKGREALTKFYTMGPSGTTFTDPVPFSKYSINHKEWIQQRPEQSAVGTSSWGNTFEFKFKKMGDLTGETWLVLKRDQLLYNGATIAAASAVGQPLNGATVSFINAAGYFIVKEYTFKDTTRTFDKNWGELQWVEDALTDRNLGDRITNEVGYYQGANPLTALQADTAASYTYYIPLKFSYSSDRTRFIRDALITENMSYFVTLEELPNLIYKTAGTASLFSCNISDMYLLQRRYTLGEHHQSVAKRVPRPFYVSEPVKHLSTFTVDAGSTYYDVKFQLTGLIKEILWLIRDKTTTGVNAKLTFLPASKIGPMTWDSVEVLKEYDAEVYNYLEQPLLHKTKTTTNIYTTSASDWPEALVPNGARNFTAPSDVYMRFTFPAALTNAAEITIYAKRDNMVEYRDGIMVKQLQY